MLKKIKNHLKTNNGDLYIEALISLIVLVVVFAALIQMSTAMVQKIWIDNKLNDISKIVAVNGSWIDPDNNNKYDEILNIENQIENKMGENGEITYHYENEKLSYPGMVQIGDSATITYTYDDFPVLDILNKYNLAVDIDISKTAVSEVYHKELSD